MEANGFTFRPGSDVEVRSVDEGSKGAWFPAKILELPVGPRLRKRNSSSKNILVQFKTIVDDKDPKKPLVEYTTLSLLRPEPPPDNAARFEQNDVVDAFHLDMWWPGVVMDVVGDMYTVGFKDPPDSQELGRDKLRSHWDWTNGVWTRAPKEVTTVSDFKPGEAVEMNLNKDEMWSSWLPAVIVGQLGGNSFLVQYRYRTPDNDSEIVLVKEVVLEHQIRPCPPLQEDTGFALMDMVDAFHDMGWWVGNVMQIPMKDKYVVKFRITGEEKEFSFSELRCHLDWIGKQWHKYSEFQDNKGSGRKSKDSCDSSQNSAEQTSIDTKFWGKQLSPCMEKFPYGETTTKLKMPPQPNGVATFLSPTPSKKLKGGSSKGTSRAQFSERKSPVKTSNRKGLATNDKGITHDNKDQMSSGRKRKGKQAKLLVQQSNDPEAGCIKDPVEFSVSPRLNPTMVTYQKKRRLELTGVKRNGTADVTKVELPKTKCVERIGSKGPGKDGKTVALTMENPMALVAFSSMEPDLGQTSSLCANEKHCEKTMEPSSNPAVTLNQQEESVVFTMENPMALVTFSSMEPDLGQTSSLRANEKHCEKTVEHSSNPAGTLSQQEESPSLPLVMVSQKPHNQPLLNMKEVSPKGSAIGCMTAFVSLIKEISKLQVSDSKDLIDKHLEALRELELLGYDVKPIRHLLNDLLGMKVKLGQLENQSKEVEIKIAEGTQDATNCDERISGFDKEIEEMQQKRMAVVSGKEVVLSEISRWQSEANDININIQNIQCGLGQLLDGLW